MLGGARSPTLATHPHVWDWNAAAFRGHAVLKSLLTLPSEGPI